MEKFVWTEDYSVGITLIDEQHRHFFEIANKILDLINEKGPEKEALFAYCEELGDYAFYHLSTEEKFFDEFKYDGALEHRAAHDVFRTMAGKYLDDARKTTTDITELSGSIVSFSSDWLKNHILVMDKHYAAFFREHGLR
jgi:hemerythrin-like metal-binding protein